MWTSDRILEALDACCDAFTFPMLDNGYVYLAATRLSLHRSADDWALAIEVFGFSPRGGVPDIHVHTFGSRLHARDTVDNYVTRDAYENHLSSNPHNDSRFYYPIAEGPWQDEETSELVAETATEVVLRGKAIAIPPLAVFAEHGIELEEAPRIQTFELTRLLAATHRDDVLAAPTERRVSVGPELREILVLDEWHHPDVADDAERPSGSDTFRQLANVLVTGDVDAYRPTVEPNTHWRNWPDAGSL
jgi:hypothetical protein